MYAMRRRGSFSGIVLIGPPFGRGISRPLRAASAFLAALTPRLAVRPAPPIRHISRMRAFQNELDWDPWCYHGPLRARAARSLVMALNELEKRTVEFQLPLLIVQGTKDRIASLAEAQEIFRQWGGADRTLTTMEGLYHDVLNEPERHEAIEKILAWLAARAEKGGRFGE
jgi:acylglycerol lipase